MVGVAVGERERVERRRVEAELPEVVGHRLRGEAEVEGDPRRLAPARHLHVVGEAVLRPEVGDLPRPRDAPAPRHLLVRAQDVDGVVDDRGDADAVDRRQARRRAAQDPRVTRASVRPRHAEDVLADVGQHQVVVDRAPSCRGAPRGTCARRRTPRRSRSRRGSRCRRCPPPTPPPPPGTWPCWPRARTAAPASNSAAALSRMRSAASTAMWALAIGNCTPWLAPIGLPKITRWLE